MKNIYAMTEFAGERKPEGGGLYNRFLGKRTVILSPEVWKDDSDLLLLASYRM